MERGKHFQSFSVMSQWFYDRKLNAFKAETFALETILWEMPRLWPIRKQKICSAKMENEEEKKTVPPSLIYCHKKLRTSHHHNTLLLQKEREEWKWRKNSQSFETEREEEEATKSQKVVLRLKLRSSREINISLLCSGLWHF